MAKDKLSWGLLSTARINRAIINPIQISQRNQLIAVASRSIDQAQTYAKQWGIPRSYGSYEDLLADPEIDVVYNPLPNSLHAEWCIHAANSGKHVLCEKPIALTVADVNSIAIAARQNEVIITEAFMYRHHPQTLRVKDLIEQGIIGNIMLVRGSFSFQIANENDIRLDPALGGGSIWDIGCYPINYSRTILGSEPLEVFGSQRLGSSGVDETFIGQLRFSGDVFAQFDCSFRSPERMHVQVIGSQGSISIPNPFKPELNEKIIIYRGGNAIEEITIQGMPLYRGEVEDITSAVLDGIPPRISLEDSINNVATIVALLKSAQINHPVVPSTE